MVQDNPLPPGPPGAVESWNYWDVDNNMTDENGPWVKAMRIFKKDGAVVQRELYVADEEPEEEQPLKMESKSDGLEMKPGLEMKESHDTGIDPTRSDGIPLDNYDPIFLQTDGPVRVHLHNMTPDYQMSDDHITGDVVTGYQEGAKTKRAAKTLLEYEQEELDALDKRGLEITKMLQYVYNSMEDCKICKALHNTVWREDDPRRPILPSEGLGEKFYNTHPNCKCSWIDLGLKIVPKDLGGKKHGRPLAAKVQEVADERARITDEYLYPLKEALMMNHIQADEFPWIPQDVRLKMKDHTKNGRCLLIVAAGPSITDHRVEGEKLRRMWTEDLMKKMTYTAVGKGRDINHMIPCKTNNGFVYDAEWNESKKRMEFIVWEEDQEILQAIRDNIITSVSINTGTPRTIEKVCYDDECFMQPTGTILGEANGIAFAYIVTKEGWRYNGRQIRAIPPGIKYTKIYLLE